MNDELSHPTVISDPDLYRTRLEEIREKRIKLYERRDTVARNIAAVKFGTVREVLAKKLNQLDKILTKIDQSIDKADILLKDNFSV